MALNNVPNPGQTLADSRPLINANFAVIDTSFLVDHVDYNVAGQGKHNKVTFPAQVGAPVFAGTDNGLYSLAYNNGGNTKVEIFNHKQTLGGTADIPFTASVLSSTAPANNQVGWTYLPSGILLRWDEAACNGNTLITFGGGWPGFTNLFTIIATPISPTAAFQVSLVSILSNTQFRLFTTAAGNVKILAIGR